MNEAANEAASHLTAPCASLNCSRVQLLEINNGPGTMLASTSTKLKNITRFAQAG
jgi:hypothetical protein